MLSLKPTHRAALACSALPRMSDAHGRISHLCGSFGRDRQISGFARGTSRGWAEAGSIILPFSDPTLIKAPSIVSQDDFVSSGHVARISRPGKPPRSSERLSPNQELGFLFETARSEKLSN